MFQFFSGLHRFPLSSLFRPIFRPPPTTGKVHFGLLSLQYTPSSNPLNFISNSYEAGAGFLCLLAFRKPSNLHNNIEQRKKQKKARVLANRDRRTNQINSFPMFSRSKDSAKCLFPPLPSQATRFKGKKKISI